LQLLTSNYVVVETNALVRARLGNDTLRRFHDDVLPVADVLWVSRDEHDAAVERQLREAPRRLSLVDLVSFAVMRRADVETAFAFDDDFRREGFALLA
jgi:predicted nucleic acid-binding protein